MTLSRVGDSVPCVFQESLASGMRSPDWRAKSPREKTPLWLGQLMSTQSFMVTIGSDNRLYAAIWEAVPG
jgi:hypothetical protein